MKKLLTILLLFTSFAVAEIATIDMNTTFLKYHRTIKAEKKMREQLKLIETRAAEMKRKYDAEVASFEKLMRESTDITIDKETRKIKKELADEKKTEIIRTEKTMRAFNTDAKELLRKQHDGSREEILKEIKDVIKALAIKNNYDIVLDNSGKTSNLIPAIIVSGSKTDITQDILKTLNKGHEQFIADWEREKNGKPQPKK